jgi:hypothetical protein
VPADSRLLEAYLNADHSVAGLRLRPFCARHHVLLDASNSPYLHGGPIGWPQLDVAASICASRDWSWRAPGFWARMAMRLSGGWDLRRHHFKMQLFLRDHWTPPQVWEKAPSGPLGRPAKKTLPAVFSTVAAVVYQTGWSDETVWNMPLAVLEWYAAAFSTFNGSDLDLVTEAERQAMLKAKR